MKQKLIYEGKSKRLYQEGDDTVIVYFKDEATAFNGLKKSVLEGKGVLNNHISTLIYQYLIENKIKTHYIKTLNDREQLCHKVDIIPIEVIIRNIAAGSFSKKLAVAEGFRFKQPTYELCYKNDDLNDPFINESYLIALDIADAAVLAEIKKQSLAINDLLVNLFAQCNIELVDFKLEFGLDPKGNLLLADEISPDNCRLWDKTTEQHLDKDAFRRDIGDLRIVYKDVLDRLQGVLTR